MRLRRIFNCLATFVLIIVLLPQTFAEESSVKDRKSFLWEVKSSTSTVYLLGSIHFAKKEMYPLNSTIEDAFEKASSLVVEINPATIDQVKMQKEIFLKGVYTGDKTVKDALSKEVFDMLKTHLEKNNIPIGSLMKFRPGMLAITLSSIQLIKLGFSPVYGIDAYFVKKAQGRKPILELETMDEQLSLFLNMPDDNLFLKHTILDLSKMKQQMGDIMSSWNDGDANKMNNLMFKEPLKEYPELLPIYQRVFFERNMKLTRKIEDFLNSKKTYFVVVGSGHLVGEKGVVSLLRKAKYTIRQL